MFTVKTINLFKKKDEKNKISHHTNDFFQTELIIRRGQIFDIKIELSRPYVPKQDQIVLEFRTGIAPDVKNGTLIIVKLVDKLDKMAWGAKITESSGNFVTLSIMSSPKTSIGKYELTVKTKGPTGEFKSPRDPQNDIYILFNPWCENDTVYLENDAWRKEYVLNAFGMIYYGNYNQIGKKPWNFAQFSFGVLEACMYLLEKGRLSPSDRADPIHLSRAMTAMVNYDRDDKGVIIGKWSGDFSGGTSPMAWAGSGEILRSYHTNRKPVSYGQCWVFAGVLTTVMRCLGIACRTITNFQSAHDTDKSITTDEYFDEQMKPLENKNRDSIWNFHCWNEAWMARPDLSPGFGGWQVVDSTPQELSGGTYQCGPSSLLAIKHGKINLQYDTPFIFAEVDSDKVYWQRQPNGTFKMVDIDRTAVGIKISTKAVGRDEREDITRLYKYEEGSHEERTAVKTAVSYGSKPLTYMADNTTMRVIPDDVELSTLLDDKTIMGSDILLNISLNNKSSEQRDVTLYIHVAMMYYSGVVKENFKGEKKEVQLMPTKETKVQMVIPYKEYERHLLDMGSMKFTITGQVKKTNQILAKVEVFRLRSPNIDITLTGVAVVGQEMKATFVYTNVLPKNLTEVILRIEGPGLLMPRVIKIGEIKSEAKMVITESFTPSKPGQLKLLASLDSPQLNMVHGMVDVNVK